MKNRNSGNTVRLWMAILILLVSVSSTFLALSEIMNSFLMDDSGAISLIPEHDALSLPVHHPAQASFASTLHAPFASDNRPPTISLLSSQSNPAEQETTPSTSRPITPSKPGFDVSDDTQVWQTNTSINIFSISYQNGEQIITVQSANGDKVIAPGTENSYVFKLKNTGNVGMDYLLEIDAYFSPADITIPITARLSRYDGEWLVGTQDAYADIPLLDAATDKATLGVGKFTYYTLDWIWPFESGNDELDTLLGNMAENEELRFTITIKTTATVNPDGNGGIDAPQTGDTSRLVLWTILAIVSFALFLLLVLTGRDKRCFN